MIYEQKLLTICFLFCCSLFGLTDGGKYETPPKCAILECPKYQVIDTKNDFEIRIYKSAFWVSGPEINSSSYTPAASKGFLILLHYTKGENDQAAKLNLTAPVLVDVSSIGEGTSSFKVYFYVQEEYQEHPPLSNKVQLVKLPLHKFAAVRRFGGYINDTTIPEEVSALKESLKGTGWDPAIQAPTPYTFAAYNSPFEEKDRVNEVLIWFDL